MMRVFPIGLAAHFTLHVTIGADEIGVLLILFRL
jgi:hypothetical protein